MKKKIKITLAFGLLLALGACSTAPGEGEGTGEEMPAADAGTDAVPPMEGGDAANPPPAEDGSMPPVADGSTPPPPDGAADMAAAPPPPEGDPSAVPPPPGSEPPAAATPPASDAATVAATVTGDTTAPTGGDGSGNYEDYKVHVGDTLMKIAFEVYGDLYKWKAIYEANKDKIRDPNHIPANLVLKVEKPSSSPEVAKNGERYLIKSGDTLGSISQSVYGSRGKWKTIWKNNKQLIRNPNKIFAGFYLYYQPDGQHHPEEQSEPATSPAPMAEAAPAAVDPAAAAPQPGMGDVARAPAADPNAVPPPPAPEGATATQ